MSITDDVKIVEQDAKKVFKWVLDPTHLVLIGVAALAIVIALYFHDAHRSAVADAKVAVAEAKAQASEEKAVAADKANVAIQANNERTQALVAEEHARTLQAMAARQQVVVVQQQKNAALPPDQLAQRMMALVPVGTTAPAPGGFLLDPHEMLAVTNQLERVPQLTQDVASLQKDAVKAADALKSEKDAHASDTATCKTDKQALTDKNGELKADNDKLKADAKKNRWKHLLLGGVIVEAVRIYLTHKP